MKLESFNLKVNWTSHCVVDTIWSLKRHQEVQNLAPILAMSAINREKYLFSTTPFLVLHFNSCCKWKAYLGRVPVKLLKIDTTGFFVCGYLNHKRVDLTNTFHRHPIPQTYLITILISDCVGHAHLPSWPHMLHSVSKLCLLSSKSWVFIYYNVYLHD